MSYQSEQDFKDHMIQVILERLNRASPSDLVFYDYVSEYLERIHKEVEA